MRLFPGLARAAPRADHSSPRIWESPLQAISFVKMQAAGNDFVVVDGSCCPGLDWPSVARRLCRRRFGIGSDGLMVVEPSAGGGYLARMFDPDGCEDFCGNGTRCAAAFLHHQGLVRDEAFQLDTRMGRLDVRLHLGSGVAVGATVNMGRAAFEPERIPATFQGDHVLQRELEVPGRVFEVSSVSTGTTHTVLFVDALPSDGEFLRWSPQIEKHPAFEEGTSVLWVVVESTSRARVRIWERGGVGESLACGTGACAVVAVGNRLGLTSDRLTVVSKGGELRVVLDGHKQAWLTGPAWRVFTGKVLCCGPSS